MARQGNPLFNEGLVAIKDKDLYSRTSPVFDAPLFRKYAVTPELAALINALVFGSNVAPTTNRTDIAGIFIPDLIKVDLSTGPARLAGGGPTTRRIRTTPASRAWASSAATRSPAPFRTDSETGRCREDGRTADDSETTCSTSR